MDLTAPKVAEVERFDPSDVVDQLATDLANQIKTAKHFIVLTGAGVSTSAGIPDFRGPEGVWTRRAQGRDLDFKANTTLQAIPTPTHMALVELQNRGLLKYLVSQNCDGLHRRSGMLPDRISELHGYSNREYCKDCGKEFIRGIYQTYYCYFFSKDETLIVARFPSRIDLRKINHRPPHRPQVHRCGGALHDTIINFGEDLPKRALSLACDHAKKADLCLVLGSSLRVTPANSIPEIVGQKKKAKLAICNLQSTPFDDDASLRIYAKTDDLMIRIMEKLDTPIPKFILRRQLVVEVETQADERHQVKVYGVDVDGTPVTFLQLVKLEHSRRAVKSEPFIISIRERLDFGSELKLELEFMGHYGEPNLVIVHAFNSEADRKRVYLLEYNPQSGVWAPTEQGSLV